MEAKGKKYLKIVGILMIVFGAISTIILLMALLALVGGGMLMASAGGTVDASTGLVSGILVASTLFSLVYAIFELVTGVIGVKNCEKTEKADTCLKLGIVLVVFSVLSSIITMIGNGFSVSAVLSLLMGLVLPVLFCYGAKLNQQK